MNKNLPQGRLQRLCGDTVCGVLRQSTAIVLAEGGEPPSEEVCTVYTSFSGERPFTLALSADGSFFRRVAQRLMRREKVDLQDMADSAVECFNMLCGHIVGALYRETGTAPRFQIPSFCRGAPETADRQEDWSTTYRGDRQERARLYSLLSL